MTAMLRQQSRVAVALLTAFWAVIVVAGAATTERVVADYHTGLAISGFDPVAYFTDAAARLGVGDHEFTAFGVTWRFRNEGNLAAFAAAPQVYAPQFGGYDPVVVARGVATPGHPQLWLVHEQKLYLFHASETQASFAANPHEVLEAAEDKWPEVEKALVP